MGHRLLAIYLNDHLAMTTGEVELARRARGANKGSELGDWLGRLCDEVASDAAVQADVMAELDVGRDRMKMTAAWAAEKIGRLKLNGRLNGYSPLSRLLELEMLQALAANRLGMWQALHEVCGQTLSRFDLPALIERADGQRAELERRRLEAAADGLA